MKRRLISMFAVILLVALAQPPVPVAAATVLREVMPDENLRQAIRDRLSIKFGDVELDRMQDILNLDASGMGIKDISGLEFCINMARIDLSNNQIEDISALAKMYSESTGTNLREINLANNRISDISPLRDLSQLDILNLAGNRISDLSAFSREAGSYGVTVLNLSENEISDVTPLASLSKISILHLADNRISDVSAMTDFIGFGVGDILNLYGNPLKTASIDESIPLIQAKRVGVYWGEATLAAAPAAPSTEAPVPEGVTLATPLETVVRELLQRPQGSLLAEELALLTALDLNDRGVSDITGLGYFSNLRHLYLSGNEVTDISALAALEFLQTVRLDGNPLGETALSVDIPALVARGVTVVSEVTAEAAPPPPPPPPDQPAPLPATPALAPAPAPPPAPTPAPTPPPAPTPEPEPQGGSPVGAIAGGAAAGLIVIGGLGFWWFRRRAKGAAPLKE